VSANLELVRSIFESWGRGEFSSVEWADPEVEMVLADGPDPGSFKGLADVAEGWRGRMSAWKDARLAAEEFRELDDERILVLTRFSGHGKKSGLDLDTKGANILHVREGKVTRIVRYWDREHGLDDLDLPSESSSARG
jgi:ketosteroid isomerase-like protein